jgi:hypothetical protein
LDICESDKEKILRKNAGKLLEIWRGIYNE